MLFSRDEKKIAGESSQPVLVNDQGSLAGLANQEILFENQQPILKNNILSDDGDHEGIPKKQPSPSYIFSLFQDVHKFRSRRYVYISFWTCSDARQPIKCPVWLVHPPDFKEMQNTPSVSIQNPHPSTPHLLFTEVLAILRGWMLQCTVRAVPGIHNPAGLSTTRVLS